MARDPTPVSDDELDTLREEMDEQRAEIRAFLAEQGIDACRWGLSGDDGAESQ